MLFVYVCIYLRLAILFKHHTQCIGEKDDESVNRNNLSDKLTQQTSRASWRLEREKCFPKHFCSRMLTTALFRMAKKIRNKLNTQWWGTFPVYKTIFWYYSSMSRYYIHWNNVYTHKKIVLSETIQRHDNDQEIRWSKTRLEPVCILWSQL